MGKILYMDMSLGIRPDAAVGALLRLGADEECLKKAVALLAPESLTPRLFKAMRCGMQAQCVALEGSGENACVELKACIKRAAYPAAGKAVRVFEILDRTLEKDEAHLPLTEAVYIVAFALGLERLGAENVVLSALTEGTGCVISPGGAHRVLPSSAVLKIAQSEGLSMHLVEGSSELVSPAGAALAAAIGNGQTLPDAFHVRGVGVGAGQGAGVVRLMLLESVGDVCEEELVVLESNIDDSTGEMLGFVMECLMAAGALDCWFIPIYMKKNRPAYQLNVLIRPGEVAHISQLIFSHTTTIGIRRHSVLREGLKRWEVCFETPYGQAKVKACSQREGVVFYPEYESVRRITRSLGGKAGFPEVYAWVRQEACARYGGVQDGLPGKEP